MVKLLCSVQRRASSTGANPARQLSFQPVAVGAAMEVTKSSEPSTQRVASGDSASGHVKRVNADQASKEQDAGADLVLPYSIDDVNRGKRVFEARNGFGKMKSGEIEGTRRRTWLPSIVDSYTMLSRQTRLV
jgi:hypothetical protein